MNSLDFQHTGLLQFGAFSTLWRYQFQVSERKAIITHLRDTNTSRLHFYRPIKLIWSSTQFCTLSRSPSLLDRHTCIPGCSHRCLGHTCLVLNCVCRWGGMGREVNSRGQFPSWSLFHFHIRTNRGKKRNIRPTCVRRLSFEFRFSLFFHNWQEYATSIVPQYVSAFC